MDAERMVQEANEMVEGWGYAADAWRAAKEAPEGDHRYWSEHYANQASQAAKHGDVDRASQMARNARYSADKGESW